MRFTLSAILFTLVSACVSSGAEAPRDETLGSVELGESLLVVNDMQQTQHDLGASLTGGREVVLVFWQTWCAACIREAPQVVAAAQERAGVTEFVGVISGPDKQVDEAEVRRLTAELGLTYPQVRDRSAALARRFDVQGTPTIVVIQPDGRISFRGHRLPEAWNLTE